MRILTPIFLSALILLTPIIISEARADTIAPRAVSLSDASRPPTHTTLLHPHHRADLSCRDDLWPSDVSVYHSNGAKLSRQHIIRRGWSFWPTSTGRVAWLDGIFRNHSSITVRVAIWCE
jgi:hypothetical protein